jgi:nucleoside-diphosphate-sugar epimerase/uncharacterized membrane protein
MSKEIVLVTGATGFIGSAVVRHLAGRYKTVSLDRAGGRDSSLSAERVGLDVSTDEGVASALQSVSERYGKRIASVIHLAAYFDISGEPNPLYEKITVQGARRLIDGLQTFQVEQFVFASTMLVHRPTDSPDKKIDEASAIEPSWAYPESKVRTEALLRERHGAIPLMMLRIAGVYDDEGHSPFIAEQIAGIYEHRLTAHLYPGMLCAGQSFVHLDDLTQAIADAVQNRRELPPELPLLIGEPEAIGYAEVQDIIGRTLHGEDWSTLQIPQSIAKAGAWLENKALGEDTFVKPWMVDESNAHYVLDTSRARRLLGWKPAHSLRDTLPKMVAALKRDPTGWYKANKLDPSVVAWHDKGSAADIIKNGRSSPKDAGQPDRNEQASDVAPAGAQQGHGEMIHGDHGDGSSARGSETGGDRMGLMEHDARRARWAYFATVGLGLWLAASPLSYDGMSATTFSTTVRAVTVDRGLADLAVRVRALAASDLVSGVLIALFGALSLSKRTAGWAPWATTAIGLWLLFAPMIFWTPSGAQYLNDTIIGVLAISLSVLIPMMPGMSMEGMMDPKVIPPGWTYCPSSWAQRLPIALLGLIGLLISRVLTAYQLGHIDGVWDAFFAGAAADPRNGTEEIITSSISKAWPVPDAGIGAIAYTLEILMAVMGGRDRWRTMPWMVTFFGILVIPLGVISIYFIIIQPVLLGTWCALCLIAALAMLIMIPLALDEVVAMGQYLWWAHCNGKPVVRIFFQGGAVDGGQEDHSDPLANPRALLVDALRGVTVPWTLAGSIAVGGFLMLTRVILGASGSMANSDHVTGALAISVAVIATAEVARPIRFVNCILGAWLVGAPVVMGGASLLATIVSVVLGVVLIALSLPRGELSRENYAGWARFVF